MLEVEVVEGETMNDPNPDLEKLNRKGIKKLYDLIDGLDTNSEPDLVRACIESLAKLNTSLRGNNIFAPKETEDERKTREKSALVEGLLKR